MTKKLFMAVTLTLSLLSSAADTKGWRTSAKHRREVAERALAAQIAAEQYAAWYVTLKGDAKRVEDLRQMIHQQADEMRDYAWKIRELRAQFACANDLPQCPTP